jgi:hypothetical protein
MWSRNARTSEVVTFRSGFLPITCFAYEKPGAVRVALVFSRRSPASQSSAHSENVTF